jgi:histidyl-tRNA synthetase
MRDFLPAEKARRERILSVIRSAYRDHGFDEIETPVMEDSSRLHAGLGGENEKLAYGVLKRGLSAEAMAAAKEPLDLVDLGLRFDLTVPLARFYASHRAELPGVFRAVQIAPVWRAERPQKGRYRQFVQCDIDVLGEEGSLAEVELLTATADVLQRLGLTECSIRVNDRRILAGLLSFWDVPADAREAALVTLDKLDKVGVDGVVAELSERGLAHGETVRRTLLELGAIGDGWSLLDTVPPAWLDVEVYRTLLELREALPDARLVFSPDLVRGMGYYTGTIFEIAHPDLPYSLGGGGRYDGMIGRFLGANVPAVGFSLGFERLVDLVDLPPDEDEQSIALLHQGADPAALARLKSELIRAGSRVRLMRRAKSTKAQLEELKAEGFRRFAFVGPNDSAVGDLALRDLG